MKELLSGALQVLRKKGTHLPVQNQPFAFLRKAKYGEIWQIIAVSKNLVSSFKELQPQLQSLGATNEEGVKGSACRDGLDISFSTNKLRAGWQGPVTHHGNMRRQQTFSLSLFPSHSLYAKAPGNWVIWLYSTFLLLEQSLRI